MLPLLNFEQKQSHTELSKIFKKSLMAMWLEQASQLHTMYLLQEILFTRKTKFLSMCRVILRYFEQRYPLDC